MGHTRQCQPRVLPLRELSPSCKTTSRRVFSLPQQRSWPSEEPRQRAEPVASGMGVPAPGCSLQTPPGPAPSHSRCHGEVSHPMSNTLPLSPMLLFLLSDFFTFFPDPAESLNLPNASLPSYRRTGCRELFFLLFFFFFGQKRD